MIQSKTIYFTFNKEELSASLNLTFLFDGQDSEWYIQDIEILEVYDEHENEIDEISDELKDFINEYVEEKQQTYIDRYCKGE